MRFGAIVDENTRKTIEHGRRIRAVLSQPENAPLTLAEQAALLLAVAERLLDALPLSAGSKLQAHLAASLTHALPGLTDRINQMGVMDDKDRAALLDYVNQSLAALTPPVEKDAKDGASRQT
jgi:F-type H+-transporting ATPase subunit alpha